MNECVNLYFIKFEGVPLPENPESEDCGGAYINCWVNSEEPSIAMDIANNYIRNEGWEITKVEESFITDSKRYKDELESLDGFNQAIEYGVSAIFYTWPKE